MCDGKLQGTVEDLEFWNLDNAPRFSNVSHLLWVWKCHPFEKVIKGCLLILWIWRNRVRTKPFGGKKEMPSSKVSVSMCYKLFCFDITVLWAVNLSILPFLRMLYGGTGEGLLCCVFLAMQCFPVGTSKWFHSDTKLICSFSSMTLVMTELSWSRLECSAHTF